MPDCEILYKHFLDRDPVQLGGVTKGMSPSKRGPIEVLRLTSDRNVMPEVVTVSFDVRLIDAAPALTNTRLQVLLEWGSYKGGGRAIVDLKHGSRFALECSTLAASILVAPAQPAAAVGPTVDVYASVGRMPVTRNVPATFTDASLTLVDGVPSVMLQIPQYAHSISVLSNRDPFGMPFADFRTSFFGDNAIGSPAIAVAEGNEDPLDIPAGAEFVQFVGFAQKLTPLYQLVL